MFGSTGSRSKLCLNSKIDGSREAVMTSNAKYYWTTCNKRIKLSSSVKPFEWMSTLWFMDVYYFVWVKFLIVEELFFEFIHLRFLSFEKAKSTVYHFGNTVTQFMQFFTYLQTV